MQVTFRVKGLIGLHCHKSLLSHGVHVVVFHDCIHEIQPKDAFDLALQDFLGFSTSAVNFASAGLESCRTD